ncbi:MAG TPA: methyltransferase domain-containing protein, partial [Acidimicrobiales bacterium]
MLTVDYDRLGVGHGDRLLDLGSGGGRHAYEAVRKGASVVALDADSAAMKDAAILLQAMADEAVVTGTDRGCGLAMVGDAVGLPFPDQTFDRVIAAE